MKDYFFQKNRCTLKDILVKKNQQIEAEFLSRIGAHQGIINKICSVYTRNTNEREDLYQEIVLQLWKSFSSFRGDSEFSSWMYRVALNTAIGKTRKAFVLNETIELKDEYFAFENNEDHSEEVEILYKAIKKLKKIEKALILLWLEEKSYEEIADTLGITVKNVSVKLVRVKAKLGELIEKMS